LTADDGAGDDHLSARIDAAGVLRRLGHALVDRDVDETLLALVTAQATAMLDAACAAPPRRRDPLELTRDLFVSPPSEGSARVHFPDCFVTGQSNPMGMAAQVVRRGDEAVLTVTLGAAFEGAPGRAHGGAIAALFDEAMGFVLSIYRTPAYTGSLSVTYRAPAPLGEPLEFRARLRSRHGRKLRIEGHAHAGDRRIAESEGLFVAVDLEHFATGGGGA